MKVTIVHNHPIHYKHLLFSELKRQGLDFDVIFLGGQSSARYEAIELSEDLYRTHVAWPGPYETAPVWLRQSYPWRKLSELSPDIVIISGYHAAECWSAWLWAMLARKSVVLWFESNEFDYPRHWPKELLKRIFCRWVNRAHVYGTSNKEYLVKLGIPAERIELKRAVVDIEHFAMAQQRALRDVDAPIRLLYVGRLAPEKNVAFLLRALAQSIGRTGTPGMRLQIAGSGPCEAALRAEAIALKIQGQVEFLGYTPQRDLPDLYRSADFFVLPSIREPWGLVALEAMLARLPVLISAQCGCTQDVVTEANGWAFSPYRVEELASLLSMLPKLSPERLQAMGAVSFLLASKYSAANCAEVIIRSLAAQQSLGRKRPAVARSDYDVAR